MASSSAVIGAMPGTSARLLSLLSLLQVRRDWPGPLLAERLGVSPRTARRDVDRLRELGYPVQTTTGPDGGYRLAAGTQLPPLLFDDEQAVALAVALQVAATTGTGIGAGFGEAAVRAPTGAPSAPTASPRARPPDPGSPRATCPGATSARSSRAGSAGPTTPASGPAGAR